MGLRALDASLDRAGRSAFLFFISLIKFPSRSFSSSSGRARVANERTAHRDFVRTLGSDAVWLAYFTIRSAAA
jgi:hypothetical protein